ncbi:protocadherin beta-2-like isoform X1 [Argonauta hians]
MAPFAEKKMIIQVCTFLLLAKACICVYLTYQVEEGQNPGSYIGDIAADTHLTNGVPMKDQKMFWFRQLQRGGGRGGAESEPSLFNISKSGKLYTAQVLDAESLCKYNTECFRMIDVAVRNKESFVKILEIKIIIKDVNDNKPDFQSEEFQLEFTETDMKGTTKFIPNAIDRDVGISNSQLNYRLRKEMSEPFTLSVSKKHDGSTEVGIVLQEKLDREFQDSYHVQVVANDGGVPSKQGVLDVLISVIDINDNRPVFSQNIYNITVNNGHLIYVPVAVLSAKDLDSGKNGRVSYYFSTKSSAVDISYFELNKTSGELYLQQKFFTEPKKSYKLLIEARDEGMPSLSSTATVLVNVLNQQNNAPEIDFISLTTNDVASIYEGVKVNSFIAYVKVTDNDIGRNGEVNCELKHDKLQLQSMGKMKYKIVTKSDIDREIDNFIHFTIMCQDNGTPPLRTTKNFSIQVMDVNDVQPRFTKDVFRFLIFENEDPNFPIGFINATDPDLDEGSDLIYSLLNNQGYLPFEISNFGFISTTRALDREQREEYKFKVFVKDNGTPSLNNTANVVVEVIDKNDNAPYFTFPSVNPFNLDVHYHPQSNNDITTLRASDRDSHVNAFLRYEIQGGNEKQLFTVNLYTGVLSFSRPVYQNDAGSYNLEFVVKDSGEPVLSATCTLSLTLTVSNKTSKMFTAVQKQTDDKIHINLLIIMLVATVIVALVVVISITVCIVRRNNMRNNQYGSGVHGSKLFSQNNMSEYICGQVVPQYDVPVTVVSEQEHNRSSQSTLLRQDPQLLKKAAGQNWKIPPPGTQLTNTLQVAQKTPQRISSGPDVEKENCSVATLSNSYSGKASLLSREATLYEELSGHKSKSSQLHTLSRGKHPNPTTKGSSEAGLCSNNPTNNDVIDLKSIRVTSTTPNIPSQHWNLPTKNSFTAYAKPLPAVPKDTKTELV